MESDVLVNSTHEANTECPECHSNSISKTESINGVDVEYNLEKHGEALIWVKDTENWYGQTYIHYVCMNCGKEWESE